MKAKPPRPFAGGEAQAPPASLREALVQAGGRLCPALFIPALVRARERGLVLVRFLEPAASVWSEAKAWDKGGAPAVSAACAAALERDGGGASPLAPALAEAVAAKLPELQTAAGLDTSAAPDLMIPLEGEGGMLAATAGALTFLRSLGLSQEICAQRYAKERQRWGDWTEARAALEDPAALAGDRGRLRKVAALVDVEVEDGEEFVAEELEILAETAATATARALWRTFQAQGNQPPLVLRLLAWALLPAVRELAEREAKRGESWGGVAAQPRAVARMLEAAQVHGPDLSPEKRLAEYRDPLRLEARPAIELLPQIDASLLRPGAMKALNTLAAARLPAFLTWETYRRTMAGKKKPGALVYLGGAEGMARAMGLGLDGGVPLMRAIEALAALQFRWPNGDKEGGIIHWYLARAAPGRKAELTLDLPDLWLPGYAARMKDQQKGTPDDRLLVFLSDPVRRWGEVHPSRKAPQERLAMALYRVFAERSRELAGQGGLALIEADWLELADFAGVSPRRGTLDALRESLTAPKQADLWPCVELVPGAVRLLRIADPKVHAALMSQGAGREKKAAAGRKGRGKRRADGQAKARRERRGGRES